MFSSGGHLIVSHDCSLQQRYIPFNGGPRLCVGQQFALTEMGYTVTRILQKYERVENRMSAPPKWKADIVLQPAEGVHIAFIPARK